MVRITSQWNQLETIILNGRDLEENSPEQIRYILENSPNLKTLNILGCHGLGLSIEGWNMVAKQCSNLRNIMVEGGAITDSNLNELTKNNKNLKNIDLEHCKLITDQGIQDIFRNCRKLKTLRLTQMWGIWQARILVENAFSNPFVNCLKLKNLDLGHFEGRQ